MREEGGGRVGQEAEPKGWHGKAASFSTNILAVMEVQMLEGDHVSLYPEKSFMWSSTCYNGTGLLLLLAKCVILASFL